MARNTLSTLEARILAVFITYHRSMQGIDLTAAFLARETAESEAVLQPALNHLVDTGRLLWCFTSTQWTYRLNPAY